MRPWNHLLCTLAFLFCFMHSFGACASYQTRHSGTNADAAAAVAAIEHALSNQRVNETAARFMDEKLTQYMVNINSTDSNSLVGRDWTTVNWIGLGLASTGGSLLTWAGLERFCKFKSPYSGTDWNCVKIGVGTLFLAVGSGLITGSWPTEGAIGALNPVNKKRDRFNSMLSGDIRDLVSTYNNRGLKVHIPEIYGAKMVNDVVYMDGFRIQLHLGNNLVDHYVHSNSSQILTPWFGMSQEAVKSYQKQTVTTLSSDFTYDSVTFFDGGIITSYCKYDGNSELLNKDSDTEMIGTALDQSTGFFYYNISPFKWQINDNNHGSVHICEGIISFSDHFDGTRPNSPPTGGVPVTCAGDHDDL